MSLVLGLDVDGTISGNPGFFSELSVRCRASGGQVHIVTSRTELARHETALELTQWGIAYQHLHFIPPMSEAERLFPLPDLDWYGRYLYGKVAYAIEWKLTHFVDDDFKVRQLFEDHAPGVVFVHPEDVGRIAAWLPG